MFEIIGLVFAFCAIMFLILKRVNQALAIFTGTLILGIFALLTPLGFWHAFTSVITDEKNYELMLAIALIGSLGSLLVETGVMADLTEELKKFFSPRNIVALIPAVMGLLPMPGGALFSAPMIAGEANKLDITNELKTFFNIAFRHIWFWILPLSSGFIFEARFSHLDTLTLILTQLPFFFILLTLSLIIAFMKIKVKNQKNYGRINIFTLISSLGPIVAAVALNLLSVPLYIALLPSFLVIFILKPSPFGMFLRKIFRGIPWTLISATFAVLLFRAVSDETGAFVSVFTVLQGLGVSPLLFAIIFPLAIGFVSALPTTAIPLVFPLVLPILNGISVPVAVAIVYSSIITGYLISPLHMCLLLTNGYFKAELSKTYRYWIPVVITTLLGGIGIVLLIATIR